MGSISSIYTHGLSFRGFPKRKGCMLELELELMKPTFDFISAFVSSLLYSYNTAHPAPAAVERLFARALILKPTRALITHLLCIVAIIFLIEPSY